MRSGMNKQMNIRLFEPGSLVKPNLDFWLSCDDAYFHWDVENNTLKSWQVDVRQGNKVLIMKILATSGPHGLVLDDRICETPLKEVAEKFQSSVLSGFRWDFRQSKSIQIRTTDFLFGKISVKVICNDGPIQKIALSMFNDGWILVKEPNKQ